MFFFFCFLLLLLVCILLYFFAFPFLFRSSAFFTPFLSLSFSRPFSMAKTKVGKRANKNYLIPLRPLEPTVLNRLPRCRNGESGPKVLGPVRSRRLSFIPNFPTPAEGLGVAPGSQLLIPEIFHDILEVLRTFLDILATCWKNMNVE